MSAKKLISATALAFLLTAGAAAAQTGTTSTSTGTTTIDDVGTPNTGLGGTAGMNALLLATTAAIAVAGAAYLARRQKFEQ